MSKNLAFPQCLWKVVLPLLEDLDVPRSLTVKLLIEHGEYDQLVNLTTDPAQYLTADAYYRAAVGVDLLRKCADLPTGINTEEEAIHGFFAAEKACEEANARLALFINNGPFDHVGDLRIADFLQAVKRRISRTLGKLPPDVFLGGRFGPGATYSDRDAMTTVCHKISSSPTMTNAFGGSCFFGDYLTTKWSDSVRDVVDGLVTTVRGNRFTTVPKDATKDRGIAVEPSLNGFYQLALGGAIRRRLKRIGIDLDNNQPLHRALARRASSDGRLATIDLSSASDTVCKNLVKLLLPDDWFWALNTLRSPTTKLRGKTYFLSKFSSMGNGYTFDLETLIFFSISAQVCHDLGCRPLVGDELAVYGDDIICPSECASTLISVLRFCGFSVNKRKTYVSGNFRESCGGDFFNGVPVRAHFLKGYPVEPQDWIVLANGIRRMANNYSSCGLSVGPFRRAWFRALDNIPVSIRGCRGPSELGDIVICDEPSFWTQKIRSGTRLLRCLSPHKEPIPLARWGSSETLLAAALLSCPSKGPTPRGAPDGYRLRWVPFS